MPIYEYVPIDWDCPICNNLVAAIQGINDEPLKHCPQCGLDVRRVISKASIKIAKPTTAAKAGEKGFTTWKKVREGEWEKVAGPGVDAIVSSPEDHQAVAEEKNQAKTVLDFDKPS